MRHLAQANIVKLLLVSALRRSAAYGGEMRMVGRCVWWGDAYGGVLRTVEQVHGLIF